MKERPILFSDTMVQAILAGRKTQTRRVPKEQPLPWATRFEPAPFDGYGKPGFWIQMSADASSQRGYLRCPYGVPGDRLWVREAFGPGPSKPLYRADGGSGPIIGWSPSIHMMRIQSRITLEIVGVRVERLRTITAADVVAEGFPLSPENFAALWDTINAKRGYSWQSNPWVWVIEFRRVNQ